MKKARLREEQIIGILGEHEVGAKCADLCRKHGMSEGTCLSLEGKAFRNDGFRGKAFEGARGRTRKAEEVAGRADARHGCDARASSKRMVTPAVTREAVAHLKAHLGLSERRACEIAGADRKMVRDQSQRAPDTALRGRLRDLANEGRRFGYRRLFVLLRREGEASGINRIYRLYREEGLTVRKRKARRRAIGTRAPILIGARANARWTLDFVHDPFACGRRFIRHWARTNGEGDGTDLERNPEVVR